MRTGSPPSSAKSHPDRSSPWRSSRGMRRTQCSIAKWGRGLETNRCLEIERNQRTGNRRNSIGDSRTPSMPTWTGWMIAPTSPKSWKWGSHETIAPSGRKPSESLVDRRLARRFR